MLHEVDQATLDQARVAVRESGARVTQARIRVLAELLAAHEALTHQEVQRRVEGSDVDRVTIYRVLEWLVEVGLAHRVNGPDRVFRFSAHTNAHLTHGHFRCNRCERMFCMERGANLGRIVRMMLPEGFSSEGVELTVSGRCAQCAAT